MICKLMNLLGLKEFNDDIDTLSEEGHYMFADHVILSEKYLEGIKGKKVVFITRDPRDIVTARYFNVLNEPTHRFHKYNGNEIMNLIIKEIDNNFRNKLSWRSYVETYSTTFEKVVGSKESREQEIKNIAKHLEIELTDEMLKDCVDNLVGSNELYPTYFRKGIIGDWKNHFTEDHKKLFKEVAGQLLIQEGYEKDLEW